MRILLSAVLVGGVVGTAAAANYDTRLYVTPGVAYVNSDAGRGVENGEAFSLSAGLPVSDTRNYELELGWAGLGSADLINLNANLLTFFDPQQPMLFSVLSAGVLHSDGGPGPNVISPNVAAGLGAMIPAFMGKLRLEGLLRADLHFHESAGLGGKKAFIEPIIRLGYSIPLGQAPKADTPVVEEVDVIEPMGDDADNDGVSDSVDLCPGTPMGSSVDATGCSMQTTAAVDLPTENCRAPKLDEAVDEYGCAVDRAVILNGVNFDFDSVELTSEAKATLDDVAMILRDMTDARAEIAGHTSDEGDELYNIDLSQRRAAVVRRYLISAGVPSKQLVSKGYGGNAPVTANNSIKGRRENRRVEVKVIK